MNSGYRGEGYSKGAVTVASRGQESVSFASQVSASCVSYRDTTKPPEQTRRAATDIAHTTSKFPTFRRPRVPDVHGISSSVSYVLAITLLCKLASFSNHPALFDTECC
jgi:hypothetical protein